MELEESVSEDVGADLNEGFDTFIEKKRYVCFPNIATLNRHKEISI